MGPRLLRTRTAPLSGALESRELRSAGNWPWRYLFNEYGVGNARPAAASDSTKYRCWTLGAVRGGAVSDEMQVLRVRLKLRQDRVLQQHGIAGIGGHQHAAGRIEAVREQ